MSRSSDDRNPVERLAEEFLERHRRGELPSLTEYVDRHPEWGDEIRRLFPALVMMERLKPAAGDVTGSFIGGLRSELGHVPERVGDFRILREVGRGGMGIVFEAEQESLGRHVALKVLPSHALLNPHHLHRFLREARAAARLHHTNIVPVFGVGESDRLHYYVMQFIAGSGLHEVIDELRRAKAADRPTAEARSTPTPISARAPTQSLHEITRGLLTGQFAENPGEGTTDAGVSDGPAVASPPGAGTDIHHSGSSILSVSGRSFAKQVARIGLQVAQALGYAHGQGVLHRDIKPSNLLLDVQGTVWVADFGLAKAMAEGDDLTNEGDVLGTLRYMAPERFRGLADARSDLYALGLTLYELLTLRPAFDQDDRDRLIHQVMTEEPPRPRSINSEIPRDLETIILKAIEHDPARRYQDAAELSDDLERLLGDRPIQARPVGALERAGKWARRKPAIAALLAALVVALVGGFSGITWQWRQAVAASTAAQRSEDRARANFDHALETVNAFCTQVSEEELLDQPGMQPLRRRLLGLALKYYQAFQSQQGKDPNVSKELALSFMRSGVINSELGDTIASQLALLRAKDILEALCRTESEDISLRVQLARCYIEMEDAFRLTDYTHMGQGTSFSPSPRSHTSVTLMEPLVAADPQNLEYLGLLGRGYDMLGIRQLRLCLYAASGNSLRKAIATLERARRMAPEDDQIARTLALAYADLGRVNERIGHHVDRVHVLEKALAILDQAERVSPVTRRHRLDRAQCLVGLGIGRIDIGRWHEAAISLLDAEERLDNLAREDRESVDVRYWLAVALQGSARGALARGQIALTISRLRQAIAIAEQTPANSRGSRDLLVEAWSYLGLGRAEIQAGHTEAISPLLDRFADVLKAFRDQLIHGAPNPTQARDLSQIEGLVDPLLQSARAVTPAERIAAQRLEVQTHRSLADKQPDNPALRFDVMVSRVHLADLLGGDGQIAEAQSNLDIALPVLEDLAEADRGNLLWRQGLALAWETLGRLKARSGRAAEAREAAQQAVTITADLARIDSVYSYDLACVLSLRSSISSAEADAKAALAALRRAIAEGFDNEHRLRNDPRLDALRSRPDFPRLVGVVR